MKILHTVELYYPSVGGVQEIVKQLSERMVAMGHEVTIATTKLPERKSKLINGVKIVEFDISGNLVRGIKGEAAKYQKFLVEGDFDVIMNYAAQQWATDLAFEVLDKIKAKKILVPCGYSGLHVPDFKEYFAKLPYYLKRYDASVYNSPTYQDIDFARKHGIKNLHVITNAADENEFTKLPTLLGKWSFRLKHRINHFFILSVGNHTGSKGHAETLETFKHLPFASTLVIIGGPAQDGCYEKCQETAELINKDRFKRPHKKVLLLSPNRKSIELPAFKSADVFLFLSNVEASPLVLFESAAAGLPFVASAAGNSAEIAKWTGAGLITKTIPHPGRKYDVSVDIESTVELLKQLRFNSATRKKMAKAGRRNWQEKFTWQKITEEFLQLYEEVLQ